MTHEWNKPGPTPTPHELAAYVDGELDSAARERVEAWLARDAGAAREVEAWQQLNSVWQQGAPPEPAPVAWAAARDRIHEGLATARRARRLWGALGGTAAAALLAVLLSRPLWTEPPAIESPIEQPFIVATADEIQILSMDPADADALVIGKPPVQGPIDLVAADDVTLVRVEPHPDDGAKPDMWLGSGGGPWIVPGDR